MHDETFLIQSGEVTFTSRNTKVTLKAGEYLVVPPMSPHTFANEGDEPAIIHTTFTPAYYVNYFRIMARMAAEDKGALTPEIHREAMLRYATMQTKEHGYDW
jgi:mannose-6-phosphate isomerase-like protein (cupin superfamily)